MGKVICVKDVDEKIFLEFKGIAVAKGEKIGKYLSKTMKKAILEEKQKKKPTYRLEDFPIWDWGPGTERLSEQIDEIVYDGK